jgi:hypothetical protein
LGLYLPALRQSHQFIRASFFSRIETTAQENLDEKPEIMTRISGTSVGAAGETQP